MSRFDYKVVSGIRDSAILTASYVSGNIIGPLESGIFKLDCNDYNVLKVIAIFTKGSNLDSCDIKVEFSNDGTTYWQETASATTIATGETQQTVNYSNLSVSNNYEIVIRDLTARYIKISAVGNGTVTGSLLSIDAILSTR